MRFIQFRSAPAQNAGPLPASTTARTDESWSSSLKVLVSWAMSASSKALRTAGRFSVTRPTPAFFSTLINARLQEHFAFDGVGDEAFLVRLVVQGAVLLVRRALAREGHARPQGHFRHPCAVQYTDRFIDIALDYELRFEREVEEPEHVALRKGGDECLLRIDTRGRRRRLWNIAWRGAPGKGDAGFEAHLVHAAVCGVQEVALPPPFDDGAVFRHHMRKTPKRVFSMGALSAADSASASRRRPSAGSITPSSQRRALE